MKKTSIRTIALGSVALSAATAAAWFMFTSESAQKEKLVPTPPLPSSATGEISQQKTAVLPETELPSSRLSNDSPNIPDNAQDTVVDPTESLPKNALNDSSAEKQDQVPNGQEAVSNDAVIASEQVEDTKNNHTAQLPSNEKEEAPSQVSSESPSSPSSPLPDNKETDSGSAETSPVAQSLLSFSQGESREKPQDISNDSSTASRQQIKKEAPESPCNEVTPVLTNFLSKVEEKEYSRKAREKQPLQEHVNDLAAQLINNPPVVTHETDDLYTVLTNTAHFFRILGKDNLVFLQKILKQESADFEKVAAEIYRLSTTGAPCVSGKEKLEIPFGAAYEYAGFFLNTLGGRSYLFRRDPGTRLLVNYYAVLILDQANKKHANSYGLDIREQLPWLIQEMEASNKLTRKERYLDKLYELAEEYQALP